MLNSSGKYKRCKQFIYDDKPKTSHHQNEGPTVWHHIKSLQQLIKNDNRNELIDKLIIKYHDIGKSEVYLNKINKEKLEENKLVEGKNSMPFLGHNYISYQLKIELIKLFNRLKVSEDDMWIIFFVIENHMYHDYESRFQNNKEIYKMFKDYMFIKDKIRALDKLMMLYEYDKEYEISEEKKKRILYDFELYLSVMEKLNKDNEKILKILKNEKLGNYILRKLPNLPGPKIGHIKNKIMLSMDDIDSIEQVDEMILEANDD